MKNSPFSARVQKLFPIMEENHIDCMLIGPSSDMKYLSGYSIAGDERLLVMVIAPGHEPFILANSLYELQVAETPVEDLVYWNDGDDPVALLRCQLEKRGIPYRKIAVNSGMPALFILQLQEQLKDPLLINATTYIQPLRIYKDRSEMDLMIQSTAKADIALKKIMDKGTYWVGKKESDLLAEFVMEMTMLGLANAGACVAVGANAAVPHHNTGETQISMGKCLLIDFGATFMNYSTDMTRTFHFGRPSSKFRDIYNIVLEACLAGEQAAKAGNQLQDVDKAARGVIEKAGYGAYFIHRTGHGIGIDFHEGPSAAAGETTYIRPGMAFSCEPGIYLPGEFGIRIEDQILIDDTGATRILHSFPKELTIIE